MKNTQLANAVASDQADVLARHLDAGYLRLYSGAQPASANTAITTQTLLVQLRFASPSAPAAINGVIDFAAFAPATAAATGTATWYRALQSDGLTPVMDGSAGLPADNPNLSITSPLITQGGLFLLDAFSHTVAKATNGL